MQFLITAYDGTDENALMRRMTVRPAHLENMKKVDGRVLCAGGITDETGKPIGSFLTMEFDDRSALDRYLESEPYITNGVWKNVRVETCNVVITDGRMRV